MNRRARIACIAAASLVCCSNAVRAQESRVYFEGALLRSFQGEGFVGAAPDTPHPGVGGDAFGIFASVGATLHPRVSIAFEMGWPSRFDAQQAIAYGPYFEFIRNGHRDLIVSGTLHYRIVSTARLTPELVGGLSLVNEDTLQQTSSLISRPYIDPPVYGPYGPEAGILRKSLGLVAGLDVPVRLGSRVSFVPGVRVHIIHRADLYDYSASSWLHLDPLVWRAAAGLRVHF